VDPCLDIGKLLSFFSVCVCVGGEGHHVDWL
jgi:hypothetical protein